MKKLFGFGSTTPPPAPPAPPAKPPGPPKAAPAAQTKAGERASAKTKGADSETSAAAILGRWKEPHGSDTTEFHADGSVTERTASGETIRGRYSLDGGKLKIKLDAVPQELVFQVSISGGTLEMTEPDGKVVRYQKV